MAGYRLYFLADEHIKHAVTFDCGSDAEAVRLVGERADGRAMELWTGARLVRRFPADAAEHPRRDTGVGGYPPPPKNG